MEPVPAFEHQSVLLDEVVDLLALRPGQVVLDGTLGGGGHAARLLQGIGAGGLLIGVDRDPQALEAASERLGGLGTFRLVHGGFEEVLGDETLPTLNAVLLDLGVSSPQLDRAERGFSFGKRGPLDMRMDPSRRETALALLQRVDREQLVRILRDYGEERYAGRIADAILRARDAGALSTTDELAELVCRSVPPSKESIHPATRTFQALRIAVNDELGTLERALPLAVDRLAPGGRLAVISFHSLEDRIVKQRFRELARGCICPPRIPQCVCGRSSRGQVLTSRPITPGTAEVQRNPRARSAKLRGFEKA